MGPEDIAREKIDAMLCASGWQIQDYDKRDISIKGAAVREFPTKSSGMPVDYALFIETDLVGTVEAKRGGTSLTTIEQQSSIYYENLIQEGYTPHFMYESTGDLTNFCDTRDPNYRSRQVMTFLPPNRMQKLYRRRDTLRYRLHNNMSHELSSELRGCQVRGIRELEQSLIMNNRRSLIHMTMGAGKTRMMVDQSYRLLKFAGAKRILFLVDRRNLGDQALHAYQEYVVENSKFTDLYNVQHLTSPHIREESSVVISTIQRLYSILSGAEYDEGEDNVSSFGKDDDGEEKKIQYNNDIPIDTFDFIVVDEAHRSIYNVWRQVLEYFDAFIIGLTATPHEHALAFFGNNMVTRYTMDDSVRDGINVDYGTCRILTAMNTDGLCVQEGDDIVIMDRQTGTKRHITADETQRYAPQDLDNKIEAPGHIQKIIEVFKEKQMEYFPCREYVPKTLVFAKNIHHAETITEIIRNKYGKGNKFCRMITSTIKKVEDEIRSFQNDVNFRIAVSVDMLGTGFDMQSLECLLFLRRIESPVYAEQMVGRGCRTINDDRLREVTPDAVSKDQYLIVDAAGALDVIGSGKYTKPPVRNDYKSLEKLIKKAADGNASHDSLKALAGRIRRLDKRIDLKRRTPIEEVCGRTVLGLADFVNRHSDMDHIVEETKKRHGELYDDQQLHDVRKEMLRMASEPFFNPALREALIAAAKQDDLIITQKQDELRGIILDATQRRNHFESFIHKNRDKYEALKIIYNTPYRLQNLMFEHLEELADALEKPPYNLTPDKIWDTYGRLNRSKVGSGQVKLTDLISLIRFVSGTQDLLVPYSKFVLEKFEKWLKTQKESGVELTAEKEAWLRNIARQISVSCKIDREVIQDAFLQEGGLDKFYKLFPDGDKILVQMHKELTDFEEK